MNTCQGDPLGRLIYMTTMALKNCLENRLRPYDLTTEQFHVLKSLDRESGIAQHQLSEAVAKSRANITRILDRLEKKGYIERRANPDDRRSSLVYLTQAGEELMARVRAELAGIEAEVTEGLSERQVREIKDGLRRIRDNIIAITGGSEI